MRFSPRRSSARRSSIVSWRGSSKACVRLRLEALEDRRVLAPALVTSTSDDDVPGTLRYAIERFPTDARRGYLDGTACE